MVRVSRNSMSRGHNFFPILICFPEKTPAPKGKHFKFSTPITPWNIGSSRGGIEHNSTPPTVEKATYLPSPQITIFHHRTHNDVKTRNTIGDRNRGILPCVFHSPLPLSSFMSSFWTPRSRYRVTHPASPVFLA